MNAMQGRNVMQGRTALVTGSTDGVGRWVAERLAEQGARVIAHGRDQRRGRALVEAIGRKGGEAVFLPADLASLAEVRRLAHEVRQSCERLDVLVNNAGIGSGPPGEGRRTSADGFELRFAVNYLAGFLLTRLLLPLMEASAPARIVNVTSVGQQAIDFDDVMVQRGYSGVRAYCQSKLAQILFTLDLAAELQGTGVTVNCLHPATYMPTTMVRQAGARPMSTIAEGGEAILNLVASPALEGRTGLYFNGLSESRASAHAYDPEERATLRELSFGWVGLADPAG